MVVQWVVGQREPLKGIDKWKSFQQRLRHQSPLRGHLARMWQLMACFDAREELEGVKRKVFEY